MIFQRAFRLCFVGFFSAHFVLGCVFAVEDHWASPEYHEHQNLGYYLDRHQKPQAIKTVADWQIRKRHILENMQKVMGPFPQPEKKVPLDVQVLEEVELGDLVRKKIAYHTDSKQRQMLAYLFLPKIQEGKVPGILCLHQTTLGGKAEPAGLGGNPHLFYALELAKRGYVTLAPDYPSFGDSDYDFSPEYGYVSGSMKAVYDNTRSIDLLVSLPEVDSEKIGCIGHSLGGHNTMLTAVFEERIKAMVSCCGFTRFHKYYDGDLQGWTSPRYMPRIRTAYHNNPDEVPFDFPEIVASFAPRAFFACAPLHDGNFEVSGVVDVMHSAKPIYDLYDRADNLQAVYPDSAHDFPDEAREQAYRFLDQHLRGETSR